MRLATAVLALALLAHAQPVASQNPPSGPCVEEAIEAAAGQILSRWMDFHVSMEEAAQRRNAEWRANADLEDWQLRHLDKMFAPEKQAGRMAAYRNLREHARALHEWKLGVERECLEQAGEAVDGRDEVSFEEVLDYLQNFLVHPGAVEDAP